MNSLAANVLGFVAGRQRIIIIVVSSNPVGRAEKWVADKSWPDFPVALKWNNIAGDWGRHFAVLYSATVSWNSSWYLVLVAVWFIDKFLFSRLLFMSFFILIFFRKIFSVPSGWVLSIPAVSVLKAQKSALWNFAYIPDKHFAKFQPCRLNFLLGKLLKHGPMQYPPKKTHPPQIPEACPTKIYSVDIFDI
jgi:hypothetical protein